MNQVSKQRSDDKNDYGFNLESRFRFIHVQAGYHDNCGKQQHDRAQRGSVC